MTDYQELVTRLREGIFGSDEAKTDRIIETYMLQAADAIETLTRERDELLKWKEDDSAAMRVFARYGELEAERDAFRALLREAEEVIGTGLFLDGKVERARAVLARIKEAEKEND